MCFRQEGILHSQCTQNIFSPLFISEVTAMNTAMYERQRIYRWIGRNRENQMWTGSLEGAYWDWLYFSVWFDSLCVGIAYKRTSHRKGQRMSVSDSMGLIRQAFREKKQCSVLRVWAKKPFNFHLKHPGINLCSAYLKLNFPGADTKTVSHRVLKPADTDRQLRVFLKIFLMLTTEWLPNILFFKSTICLHKF